MFCQIVCPHNIVHLLVFERGVILPVLCQEIIKMNLRLLFFLRWKVFLFSLQVLQFLQKVNFTTSQGEKVTFDQNGDSPARYELINIQSITSSTMHISTVGMFDATLDHDYQVIINDTDIIWGGGGGRTVHTYISFFAHFWFSSHKVILKNIL